MSSAHRSRTRLCAYAALACAAACCIRLADTFVPTSPASDVASQRRQVLLGGMAGALMEPVKAWAGGVSPEDIGVLPAAKEPGAKPKNIVKLDQVKLEDAIYKLSRVQEATAQEERLVKSGKFKDVQRNSIKMALKMMINHYKINDQVTEGSKWIKAAPQDTLKAQQYGADAVDILETANEYFGKDLKVVSLTDDQKEFLTNAMSTTREKINNFLSYMPDDAVQSARRRVESENDINRQEYLAGIGAADGASAGILNPVVLPWKVV